MKSAQPKPNSFLLPVLKISWSEAVDNGFIRIFTGNTEYEGQNVWGNYLYLLFKHKKLSSKYKAKLLAHPQYHDCYDPSKKHVMFIFKLTDKQKERIVNPFLKGAYSKIDSDYVKAHFHKYSQNGQLSSNWRILHKDPLLRQEWEKLIGTSLPKDAEVWPRPEKAEDIYKYKNNESTEKA